MPTRKKMEVLFILTVLFRCSALASVSSDYNAMLRKNITELLDTILVNYDRKLRPNHGKSPVIVTVDVSIRSMGPVSEKDMEFSLDCYFRQKWKDERLRFEGPMPRLSLSSKTLNHIWTPDTFIRNGRKSYLHTITMPNILLRVSSDGEVYISQRLTIRARCLMYLRKFPMDTQACPLIIGSLGHSYNDVVYKWNDVELETEMGTELSQYNMIKMVASESNDSAGLFGTEMHTFLKVHFKLARRQGYYILQIYTPCTLIVFMSWVSFWINKEASPARVMMGIMTVLNMSTLGLGHRNDLPKVSYSTALDIFIITCFFFVFAALVEFAVINFANVVYIKRTVHRMSMFAGALLGAGAKHQELQMEDIDEADNTDKTWKDRLLLRHSRRHRQKRQSVFYTMAVKAARARKRLTMENPSVVVDKIDDVSKFMFPFVYFVFNAIYWTSFLYLIPDEVDSIPNIA